MMQDGAFKKLGASLGMGGLQETPSGPLTMDDLLAQSGEGSSNPVVEAQPMFGEMGAGHEGMMGEMGAGMGGEMPMGDLGMPPSEGELPQGPETGMQDEDRNALRDLIAERAQARSQRSEHFQEKNRESKGMKKPQQAY